MKFDISKKTLIIIASSIGGLIVLGCILTVVGHGNYDRDDFGRGFDTPGCAMGQGNPDTMMSGMKNIIATKDYAAFQKLFSGSRMVENINTPEKFSTRVELQTTMKTVQDLEAKLRSGANNDFGPMMGNHTCMQGGKQGGKGMMGGEYKRGNMMQRR